MLPVPLVGLSWAMDSSDRYWSSPDCHSSCMPAAGLAVSAVLQGSKSRWKLVDQVEPHERPPQANVAPDHDVASMMPENEWSVPVDKALAPALVGGAAP
jgi:hypothetical protein